MILAFIIRRGSRFQPVAVIPGVDFHLYGLVYA